MNLRIILTAFTLLLLPSSLHADWCIDATGAAEQQIGQGNQPGSQCGFADEDAARAHAAEVFGNADAPGVTYHDNGGGASTSSAVPSIPAGPNPMQQVELQAAQQVGAQIGNQIGTQIGKMLFGPPQQVDPAQQAEQLEAQREQQQRENNAKQLNDTGLYLFKQKNYAGALNEFQQALAQTPNDQNIIYNIAATKQALKDTAVAAKNSYALGQLLGDTPASSSTSPSTSPLNLVNLDSDPNVVDLRGTTKTYVDPSLVKGDTASQPANAQQTVQQLDSLLDNDADQVKKQLEQALGQSPSANIPQPSGQVVTGNNLEPSSVNSATGQPNSPPEIQNQKADVDETTKELYQALGQTPGEDVQQPASQGETGANVNGGGEAAGVKGLPGIALNDNTGNGGSKPYGIPGLPGTYVNGAGEGSGLTQPGSSVGTTADSQASQTTTEPATTETAQPEASSAPETQPQTSGEATPTVANNDASTPAQYNQQVVQMGVSPDKAGLTPLSSEPANSGADTSTTSQSPALTQLSSVAGDTKGFDGGSGSTINTSANISPGAPNSSPNSAFGDMSDLKDAVAMGPPSSTLAGAHPTPSFYPLKGSPILIQSTSEIVTNEPEPETESESKSRRPPFLPVRDCEERKVDYATSGLDGRLQQAIIRSLSEGDIIAVRKMEQGAAEHYGEGLGAPFRGKPGDSEPMAGTYDGKISGGYRFTKDGEIVLSDLDLAFIIHDRKPVDDKTAFTKGNETSYGGRINKLYNADVVAHGDLYNGLVVLDNLKARKVDPKDPVYIFIYCDGFVESGPFNKMVVKYWDIHGIPLSKDTLAKLFPKPQPPVPKAFQDENESTSGPPSP